MSIDGGNVGIGTSSPTTPLEIVNSDNTLLYLNSSTANVYLRLEDANSTNGNFIGATTDDMHFWTNNTERMRIDSSGNVGIGTSSPSEKLHVNGNIQVSGTYPIIKFSDSNNDPDFTLIGANGNFRVYDDTNDVDRFVIDSSGNVEISDGGNLEFALGTTSTSKIGRTDRAYIEIERNDFDGNISFHTTTNGSGGLNERLRIDSSGNVGIGTTSPLDLLHIKSSTTDARMILDGASGFDAELKFYEDGNAKYTVGYDSASANFVIGTTNVDTNQRLVIDSSGNVGIGTSSPSAPLTLSGDTTQIRLENTATGGRNWGLRTFGSALGIYDHTAGAFRQYIDSSGNVGIGRTPASDMLLDIAKSNTPIFRITDTQSGGKFFLLGVDTNNNFLRTDGTMLFQVGGSTTRMIITSGGNVLVGTTSTDGTITCTRNGNTYNFSATSDANNTTEGFFRGYSTSAGGNRIIIYSNGNIVNSNNSYGAISDAKLKENVTDASPKLDDLMQVQVRNFNYIGEDKKQIGVIAQELEDVFPSMIDDSTDFEEQEVTDEDGNVTKEKVDLGTTTKSVKYSVFVPMLIKAIQEQQDIINELKTRIETLENN
jgi:hypothetical protein